MFQLSFANPIQVILVGLFWDILVFSLYCGALWIFFKNTSPTEKDK